MSKNIHFSGPIVKQFYANAIGTSNRTTDNPAYPAAYSVPVPSPKRRVNLLIQNKGTTELDLTLATTGSTLKLYAGQSISFDNYNGAFSLSSYANVAIFETFA